MMPITGVPQMAAHVKGVINLRGNVIPVVDLRLRFGMPEIDSTERTCIIVLEIALAAETVLIGVVVDAVSEVLNIRCADIAAPPAFGATANTACILGMAKVNGGVKLLLDVDRVLTDDQIDEIKRAA